MDVSIGLVAGIMIFGFVLLAAEVFLIPGFGFFGISALAMLGAATYLAFTQFSTAAGLLALLISLAVTSAGVIIFPRTRWAKRFVLNKQQRADDGFVGTQRGLEDLLGQSGVTVSALRPAGIVDVGGRRIDAVSESEFIAARAPVRVTKIEGNRVVVEPQPRNNAGLPAS